MDTRDASPTSRQHLQQSVSHMPKASSSSSSTSSRASPLASTKLDNSVDKEICHWNAGEEAVLVRALIKEQKEGRQVENGFKPQAWRNVFAEGQRKGMRPKTVEQLKSRWQRLKKEYRIVKGLRRTNGFVWDDESAVVAAESTLWERYLETHSEAKPFRKKSFPLYDAIAGLVERDGNGIQGEATIVKGPSRKHSRDASFTRTEASNTPPLCREDDYEDDEDLNPSIVSGGKGWGERRLEDSMSDNEEHPKPIEVAHIMHSMKNQDTGFLPRLRPIRPVEFTNMTLPPISGIKRPSPDDRSSYPSPHPNGSHYANHSEERSKRRRHDIPTTYRDADAPWYRFASPQRSPHNSHPPAPEPSLFPSSSCLHQLSRSLNNLVACMSEVPSPISPSGSYATNSWHERKRRAWETLLEEESLSDQELASARRIFRGSVEVADEYLSFPHRCRGARTLWLKREMRELLARDEEIL